MDKATRARKTTADNVRAEMARAKVNQATVASWLGVTQPAVSARLRGEVAFDVDELATLSERLELPLAVLVTDPRAGVPFQGGVNQVPPVGLEPTTYGLEVRTFAPSPEDVDAMLAAAEAWANGAVVTS